MFAVFAAFSGSAFAGGIPGGCQTTGQGEVCASGGSFTVTGGGGAVTVSNPTTTSNGFFQAFGFGEPGGGCGARFNVGGPGDPGEHCAP
jgi:hypothetical protein